MIFVNGRKGKAIRSLIYSLNYHKILDGCEIMGLRIFFCYLHTKSFFAGSDYQEFEEGIIKKS